MKPHELKSLPAPVALDQEAIGAALVAVRQAAGAICDRWSLALVLATLRGETRFSGLMARTGIASRLLTARLRSLETTGVLIRIPYAMRPLRHEYRLTNMGYDLLSTILQLARWEQRWLKPSSGAAGAMLHVPCGARLRPELRCESCGDVVTARDMDLKIRRVGHQTAPARLASHRRSIVDSNAS